MGIFSPLGDAQMHVGCKPIPVTNANHCDIRCSVTSIEKVNYTLLTCDNHNSTVCIHKIDIRLYCLVINSMSICQGVSACMHSAISTAWLHVNCYKVLFYLVCAHSFCCHLFFSPIYDVKYGVSTLKRESITK